MKTKKTKKQSVRVERTRIFKAAGLNKDQIDYAHTLKELYSTWTLEKCVEEAKNYTPMLKFLIK